MALRRRESEGDRHRNTQRGLRETERGIETETQRVEERDIEEERSRDTNTEKKDLEKEGQIHQSLSHRWTKGEMDKETHTCKERERE